MNFIAPIGLTGGIAEGKTTVLTRLAEAGLRTASADQIAREVVESREIQEFARELLGLKVFDRALVREAIAQDTCKRRAYNHLLHSAISKRMREAEADVIEVPLLVETVMISDFQQIWVVTCGKFEQLKRLSQRLGDEEQARSLIALQVQSRAKIAFADQAIRTDQALDRVQKVTDQLAADYFVRRNRA